MADFQSNLQKIFSGLNTFRVIYISTFFLLTAVFVIYTVVLEQRGRERMNEVYELRDQHDHFENLYGELEQNVESSYLNAVKYLSQGKDIYLYQAIENISEINRAYNQLFLVSRKIDGEFIPKAIQLRGSVFQYEKELLRKLMEGRPLQDIVIQPLVSDLDTLIQDLSDIGLEEEAPSEPEIGVSSSVQVIDMSEVDPHGEAIKDQLFNMNILLQGKIDANAKEEIEQGVAENWVLIFFIVLILSLLGTSFFFIRAILNRKIGIISNQLQTLSQGELPEKLDLQKDEFDSVIANSNLIIDYFDDSSKFALKIGDGDFNYEFHPKSEQDELGNALIQMRKKLQDVAVEDKVRNWINEGQAKFGEILRNTGNDFEELGNTIVSNLVDYLNANQGVLYVKEEMADDKVRLDLLSAYAFKRKKHVERSVEVGEGLIGQVYQEKKTVFLKEVKTDHFNIVTGLGESKPSSVLIVPLKNEDDIEGVIEIASFEVFKDYQISFVEKLGESIASSIKTGKINNTTKELLAEMQTREEEMKAQEEELKQNMEELSATQEQLERLRKEDESRKGELEAKRTTLYEILNNTGKLIYLKDDSGKYVYINKLFADFLNKTVEEIIGKKSGKVGGAELEAWENLEKRALDEDVPVTDGDSEGKWKIEVSPFYIGHLDAKGVLGLVSLQ